MSHTYYNPAYKDDLFNLYAKIKDIASRHEVYTEMIFEDLYHKHLNDYR